MDSISLLGMEFFAYHGFYKEEQKIGNRYTIDIEICTNLQPAGSSDDLSHTINYESVYAIVKQVMAIPQKLLETVGENIAHQLLQSKNVQQVKVSVSKHNPPIGGVCREAKIIINRFNK